MNYWNRYMACSVAFGAVGLASAQVTLNPLTSFGGDGWLAPSEYANYGAADDTRGMAFNPITGNVYVARAGSIRILDGTTGVEVGTLNFTGVAGGTRAINRIGVSDDGQIFATNLTASISATATGNTWNVYRWTNEAAAAVRIFQGTPNANVNGGRIGDSLDVFGSGNNVQVIAGYGSFATTSTLSTTTNGVARLQQTGSSTFAASSLTYTGAASGAFRLGLTFVDQDNFIGTQGGVTNSARSAAFTGTAASIVGLTTISERGFDVKDVGAFRLFGTVDTAGTTANASIVRIYTLVGNVATFVSSANVTSAAVANTNGTGEIKFGNFAGDPLGGFTGNLYALNTNNGIQAYRVNVVPEPATMTALGLGVAALARRRKKSAK